MANANAAARAILLTLASQEGEEVAGRTLFQKIVYFENVMLDMGIEFVPYYYGPYSREITQEMEGLVATGLVEERMCRIEPLDFGGAQESRLYVYRLTERGRSVVRSWMEQDPQFAKRLESVIKRIGKSGGLRSGKALSIAAKMDHLLRLANRRVTVDEIRKEAQAVGWEISAEEAEQAVRFLADLGLVKLEPASVS